MTVSLRVMTAGDGVAYLLRSVVAGDGDRSLATPLTRYYAETGTPPGTWIGSGVGEFGTGQLTAGDVVTARQLESLLGAGRDPVTQEPLGRAFPKYEPVRDRIADRVAKLDPQLSALERAGAVARIEGEETARGTRRAVAGFDLTFSVPKSVSVLWGLADAGTQAMFVEAHHAAVEEVLAFFEREVAATRVGADTGHGLVARVDVVGVAATAYDHYDSRAGDPQLHTHVVVSNKVKTAGDGKWRTLDSQAVHASVVAVSEYYNAVLADRLTATFGVGWQRRHRPGVDRSDKWEITGVSEELIAEFSNRSRAIDVAKDQLIASYAETRGHQPSKRRIIKLRAQATLATRPEKEIHSLRDLTAGWRQRARGSLHDDPTAWARRQTTSRGAAMLSAAQIDPDLVREVGDRVVGVVAEKRSTWRHWNLWAEASRQTMGWRFTTIADREQIVAMIVDAAEANSIALTPPELATSPAGYTRPDGTSIFRPKHATVFTSPEILTAEDHLLARASSLTAASVPAKVVERVVASKHDGRRLSAEQATAIEAIVTSGRQLDLLVGPAGAGKTTAMRALHAAWTTQHGDRSVVGLAPSAAAAAVLAHELGIAAENTAKWLVEHDHGRADFAAGQLVIVDEATLAGTHTLDWITGLAERAGAKVLLVGDWAQLQSVDAGGAFSMLASARDDVPELTEVHRFTHEWEKTASLALRTGSADAIAAYARHDRLRGGSTAEMVDAAYAAWHSDQRAGLATLLVTDSTESVHLLNDRARAERIATGETSSGRDVALADDARASVGDLVISRRNDRTLRTARAGWVRNGDRWRITDIRKNGAIEVKRHGRRFGARVVLPPEYVAEHIDLGYAVTAHRAQGLTVDTAHVVVTGSTTRENVYVAMTRGRNSNVAYVALDSPDDQHLPPQVDGVDAVAVLTAVLQRSGSERSAHQTVAIEQNAWTGIAQLAAEYETIAADATRARYETIVRDALNGTGDLIAAEIDAVIASEAFGALAAQLRRAEASGIDLATMVPDLVSARTLHDAADAAAVLHYRLVNAMSETVGIGNPGLIVGLIPVASGEVPNDVRSALDERRALIEARAATLATNAVRTGEAWVQALGAQPSLSGDVAPWLYQVEIVAAYRDLYGITDSYPLGSDPVTLVQQCDANHAATAMGRAIEIASAHEDGVLDDSLNLGLELA
ncbi:MobF family relaxase [Pengzhenrongella sicca]|uniref:Relaxase domain-containing protein n=1 Tax=Pengzhenrongella sicca TaxID=2819238 RepID=A0A8A4Z9K8_9MICO|nr:MobF family relaxase [Pengzhenrongella sicca]QTE28572.1 relaxase domain-containing protein [Pengzhenrongella sicca]